MIHRLATSSRPPRRALAAAVSVLAAAALVVVPASGTSATATAVDGVITDSTDGHRGAVIKSQRRPVLRGVVGPGFTITISQDEVPAGRYRLRVQDKSSHHNYHFYGQGVDRATTVEEIGRVGWRIRLREGTYTIVCDPHPGSMTTTLTVT